MKSLNSTFLGEVATDLLVRHGDDFASLSLLFPSRRGRLFFSEELARQTTRPIWEPEWLTIDGLMEELSGLHVGDKLRLITELYQIYHRYHREDFDRFYFWGEMLLSDFDMIDKYLVNAEELYLNIFDLKQLEADLSYLNERQRALINQFWEGVLNESADSKERQHFLEVWRTLWPIYRDFQHRLRTLGFGYPGLVQRVAFERLASGEATIDPSRHYAVVGFNALTSCEKILFDHLQRAGAIFYWDYDESYLRDERQEAGMFMRENCRRYPEPPGALTHHHWEEPKQIEIRSVASDALQAKGVKELLDRFRDFDSEGHPLPLDRHTAIVLTNEDLLMPVLYSLTPASGQLQPDAVNVTMGFPLKQSAAYTFLERLIALQTHATKGREGDSFYYVDVQGLLSHPYLDLLPESLLRTLSEDIVKNHRVRLEAQYLAQTPLLRSLFRRVESWPEMADYLLEAIELVGTGASEREDQEKRSAFLLLLSGEIHKLRNSILQCKLDLAMPTFLSLLRRHIQTIRIPFEGEPLTGVQVMGILETRNLDFDRVIVLSMTDDNFPGLLDNQASYIPYHLRAAYGLPTPEHHEGVHAYYFYRLLQRAKEVVLCYSSKADKLTTGEPSRYIRQLMYESGRPLCFSEVGVDVNLPNEEELSVEKSGPVREAMERYLREEDPYTLSPTAFSRYLACPLKFYFASLAHVKEREEVSEEVDNPLFGTLLHASMERLYAPLCNRWLTASDFAPLLEPGVVEQAVRRAIEETLFRGEETPESDYPGNLILVRDIVACYIRDAILPYDRAHAGFRIEGLEQRVEARFSIDEERSVTFAGMADRLDRVEDGSYRVVDYKTGRVQLEFNGLEELFFSKNRGRYANMFQTLLYSLMLWSCDRVDAQPALFYVRAMREKEFSPYLTDCQNRDLPVTYMRYGEAFEALLRQKLTELFDYTQPFVPCPEEERDRICAYCDFRTICRR